MLVAISADGDEGVAKLRADNGLTYLVWHDEGLALTRAYGVVEGDKAHPRPATFVVGADGTIAFAKVGDGPNDRPTDAAILEALD